MASKRRGRSITLADAREAVCFCNSFSRLPETLELMMQLPRADRLTLLGESWSGCDNIWLFADELRAVLPDGVAKEMMTGDERAAWAALPETVTVYRGAGRGVNETGVCWSIDRAVAACFPFLDRYLTAEPVLVTATVQRDRIVAVKLDRQEAEVITKHATIVSVVAITQEQE